MTQEPITKTLIAEDERLDTLPNLFGKNFLNFESNVYGFMDRFCEGYSGGFWEFYQLSNGGFFMSWADDGSYRVTNPMNYFDDEMSAEAVSIGVNMYAMNALMAGGEVPSTLIDLYYGLRDFACEHSESDKILAFID